MASTRTSLGRRVHPGVSAQRPLALAKFLLGESYGTTRAGGIGGELRNATTGAQRRHHGLGGDRLPGDLPWRTTTLLPLHSPQLRCGRLVPQSVARAAGPARSVSRRGSRRSLSGEYSAALAKGDRLGGGRSATLLAAKAYSLHGPFGRLLGSAPTSACASRSSPRSCCATSAKWSDGWTAGSSALIVSDALGEEADYDPQSAAISAAFTFGLLGLHACRSQVSGQGKNLQREQ